MYSKKNKKKNYFQCFNYSVFTSLRKQKEKSYIEMVLKAQTFRNLAHENLTDPRASNRVQQKWTPTWACEQMQRIGTQGDGGKVICNLPYIANDPCIVYSFGLNVDTSFEKELKELAPHCQIYGFDPTPKMVKKIYRK